MLLWKFNFIGTLLNILLLSLFDNHIIIADTVCLCLHFVHTRLPADLSTSEFSLILVSAPKIEYYWAPLLTHLIAQLKNKTHYIFHKKLMIWQTVSVSDCQ